MPDESERRDAWERLNRELDALINAQPQGLRAEFRARLAEPREVLEASLFGPSGAEVDETGAPAFEPRSNIQEFFQAIGEGVRAAQQNLDDQSAAYIRNRPAFAPETVFRVPKVSANLRLGLTKVGTRGFNFIVINKAEETQEVEQEISFEVVAAPPPPDALEAIADLPLGQIIASNPIDRNAARERLAQEAERQKQIVVDSGGQNQDASDFAVVADKILDGDAFRRVLVHRSGGRYVLVFVPADRDPTRPEVGVAILALPEFADAEAAVVAKEYAKAETRSRALLEVLIALADRQAELLTNLERG